MITGQEYLQERGEGSRFGMQEGSTHLGTLMRWEHHGEGWDGAREERGWQGSSAPLQPPHPRRAFWGTELALEHPWPPQRCKRRRRRRKAAGQDHAERSKQGPRSASRGFSRDWEHQSRHRLTQLQPLKPPDPFLFPGTNPSCLIPPFLSLPFPFFLLPFQPRVPVPLSSQGSKPLSIPCRALQLPGVFFHFLGCCFFYYFFLKFPHVFVLTSQVKYSVISVIIHLDLFARYLPFVLRQDINSNYSAL